MFFDIRISLSTVVIFAITVFGLCAATPMDSTGVTHARASMPSEPVPGRPVVQAPPMQVDRQAEAAHRHYVVDIPGQSTRPQRQISRRESGNSLLGSITRTSSLRNPDLDEAARQRMKKKVVPACIATVGVAAAGCSMWLSGKGFQDDNALQTYGMMGVAGLHAVAAGTAAHHSYKHHAEKEAEAATGLPSRSRSLRVPM